MRSSSPSSSSSNRSNEHLAVLLAKHLWTPDSSTPHCENLYCHVPFSLFERKHHCRKCGGVFCGACSSRTTTLLDTSNLSFLQPPRNVPITAFESPISPIVDARVCDDCWDQIHGYPTTPHTPDINRPSFKRALVNPISMLIFPTSSPSSPTIVSSPSSTSSSDSSDISIPASFKRRTKNSSRNNSSASSISTNSSSESQRTRPAKRSPIQVSQQPLPQELERSYGELDAYPLRQASVLCKASGGGRWVPKESPPMDGYRPPIPGAKAPFELQMEQEEMLERQRRSNPVVRDGAFQYRFPKEPEPVILSRSPYNLSTF